MPIMLWGWNSEKLSRCYLWDQLLVGGECITPPNDMLFFYPFNWDIKDYSWNWYDLTINQWSVSFTDDYATTSWNYVELVCNNNNLQVNTATNDYTFAVTLRNFDTSNRCWIYQASVHICSSYSRNMWYSFSIANWWNWWWSSSDRSLAWAIMCGWMWWSTWWNNCRTWAWVTWSEWKKIIGIYDKTNSKSYLYCNWTLIYESSSWWTASWTWVNLFYTPYQSYCNDARTYRWDVKNMVMCSKKFTQEDIDRYNSL